MTAGCPRCKRSNASHRTTCLYCGAVMPNPTAPPPPQEQELPRHLDELVRNALRGGDVSRLKEALTQHKRLEMAGSTAASDPPAAGRAAPPPRWERPAAREQAGAGLDAIQLEVADIIDPEPELPEAGRLEAHSAPDARLEGDASPNAGLEADAAPPLRLEPERRPSLRDEDPTTALVRLEERCGFAMSRWMAGDAQGALDALEAAAQALEAARAALIRKQRAARDG